MDNQLIKYFESFPTTISLFTKKCSLKSYKLNKELIPKDISKVSIPSELKQKYTSVEINQIKSKKVKESIIEFIDTLEKSFTNDSLINLYNNVNEVNIKESKKTILINAVGLYCAKENKIEYDALDSIYHELFHMASSIYDSENDIGYCGFSQIHYKDKDNKNDIGFGINEGYTELLTKRYFGDKHDIYVSYGFETDVVSKLEKIVGLNEMQNLYLKSNLMGLIENLKQYTKEEEILKFINEVDLVSRHYEDFFLYKNDVIKACLTNIYSFLLETYILKLRKESLSIEEYSDKLKEYILSFSKNIEIGNYTYECFTEDDIIQILEKYKNGYNL